MYWKVVSPLIHFTFWGWPLSKWQTDRMHLQKKRLQELNHFQNNCHVKFILTWRRNKTKQIDTNWMADKDVCRKNPGYWIYTICIKDFSGFSTADSPICLIYPRSFCSIFNGCIIWRCIIASTHIGTSAEEHINRILHHKYCTLLPYCITHSFLAYWQIVSMRNVMFLCWIALGLSYLNQW